MYTTLSQLNTAFKNHQLTQTHPFLSQTQFTTIFNHSDSYEIHHNTLQIIYNPAQNKNQYIPYFSIYTFEGAPILENESDITNFLTTLIKNL